LRRAATGDRAAFSVLYVRHKTIVARYLVRRTRDPELAPT
jgi:DNA-directed RNA polymerase specialized sigma24 family protein